MALRQLHRLVAQQAAEIVQAGRQALGQHLAVTAGGDAVGEHAGKGKRGTVGGEAVGDGAEGLCHGAGIDDGQHRDAEQLGKVSAGGGAVEQPHHPFHQNQVGAFGRFGQQASALVLAYQPEIELINGIARGALEDHRIEKIGTGLEHPHRAALVTVVAGQRCSDRGLTLV